MACPPVGHLALALGKAQGHSDRGCFTQCTMRVFLDIDIGDRETYDREVAAHKVTADYLESVGSQVRTD